MFFVSVDLIQLNETYILSPKKLFENDKKIASIYRRLARKIASNNIEAWENVKRICCCIKSKNIPTKPLFQKCGGLTAVAEKLDGVNDFQKNLKLFTEFFIIFKNI